MIHTSFIIQIQAWFKLNHDSRNHDLQLTMIHTQNNDTKLAVLYWKVGLLSIEIHKFEIQK